MVRKRRKPQETPTGPAVGIDPLRMLQQDPNAVNWQIEGVRTPAPGHLGFQTLREMARVCQPVGALIRTRQNQVANFAKIPGYEGDVGVEIRMRDRDAKPKAGDKKHMAWLRDCVIACGVGPDPDGEDRPGLDEYLRMLLDDTMTMDVMGSELRYNRRDELHDWWAMDGATVRKAAPSYLPNRSPVTGLAASAYGMVGQGFGGIAQPEDAVIAYVQMIEGQPMAEFTREEMAYWIRNPRTDIRANGYGYAELELLVEIVTGFLNSMTYNSRFFTHNNIPQGVLSLQGNYNADTLDGFRCHWNAMMAGVMNAWRVPIISSKDGKGVTWTPLKGNNKDMMFHEWMDFLITMTCAVYTIDREEIGFGAKGAGEASSLSEGTNQSTLTHSTSKGLLPILARLSGGINKDILPRLPHAEDFIFAWAGLDPDQEERQAELDTKAIAGWSTPNEIRANRDMKPIPKEALWGDTPGNPQLFQAWSLGQQAAMQADAGAVDEMGNPLDPAAPDGVPGGPPGAVPGAPPTSPGSPAILPKVNADGTEETEE